MARMTKKRNRPPKGQRFARGGANGYAALVAQRTKAKGEKPKRRKLDDYETPEDKTAHLTNAVQFRGPVFECAAGSGRMVRALRAAGLKVTAQADIKSGHDFLKRTKTFPGNIITNPPYRDGLADAFVRQALKLADGRVAMLMETKFIHGDKRAANLFHATPPEFLIVIPERIYFHIAGSNDQIPAQFFNHVWLVWPDRKTRQRGGYKTQTIWAGGFG